MIKLISNHAMVYWMDLIHLNLFLFLANIKELSTAPAASHRVAALATIWYNITTLQHLVGLLVGPPPSGMQGTEGRAAGPAKGSGKAAPTLNSDGYPPN